MELTGSAARLPGSPSARWELYRVLGEPARLRLLALAAEEQLTIGELAELTGDAQPNVSRHVGLLKGAGLVTVRKHGTRALVRVVDDVAKDAVVTDALESGHTLLATEGVLARVADVVLAREAAGREYFARPSKVDGAEPATPELGPYVAALASLLPRRALAIDVGTGEGRLLDVLAPAFDKVIALDRSEAQLARAEARASARGHSNVAFVHGEVDDALKVLRQRSEAGADVVFAVRMLHHAPKPALLMKKLEKLVRPGGALVVLDYAPHEDEKMRDQADVWLGFEAEELKKFARSAGFDRGEVFRVPSPDGGPDAHLPWHVMVAHKLVG